MSEKYIRSNKGSLINTDNDEFKKYIMAREKAKEQANFKMSMKNIEDDISYIKNLLQEIKEVLNGNKS